MESAVLQVLRETLSPDEGVRNHAEAQLKQLFTLPGASSQKPWKGLAHHGIDGGLSLARILSAQDVDLPQRQITGVLLQQYISKHWSPVSTSFEQPVVPPEVKTQIRPIVFQLLSDPQRKVRMAAAFALSTLATYDWPDDYPDLLSQLVALLSSGSPDGVHGAMRVVSEFVKNDLSEDQLLPVVQDLVPALLAVLGSPQVHAPSTRAQTVHVFRQVLRMLETVKEEHPAAVKHALDQIAPVWMGAFKALLAGDAAGEVQANWENLGIRIEIFRLTTYKTLITLQSAFPKILLPEIPSFLHLSLSTLSALFPLFTLYYLSTADEALEPPSPTSDVGFVAPKMDIDDLACAAFDFLTPIARTHKAAPELVVEGTATGVLQGLVETVLGYTQVTRENEEEWMEDVNAFVMDEDEELEVYGVRVVGHDLIGSLIDKYPRPTITILQAETQRIVSDSPALRAGGSPDWWKPLEAALALIGGVADDIRNILDEDVEKGSEKSFDVQYLFDQVVPGLLNQTETPFLQGRAFVFASQFATLLPDALAGQYLAAAVQALESGDVKIPVKLSAVKTIKNFCRFVPADLLKPQSGKILSLLLPLLEQATGETLYLLLETIRAVLALDQTLLTPQSVGPVADTVYAVWEKYNTDPVLTAIVEEFVESLASQPHIVPSLVHALAPKLTAAITTPTTDETVHIPGEAVQLANALLRSRGGPLEEELVASVGKGVMRLLRATDDTEVIQSGGIFVGELIMHLFRKAGGAIGPVLPDLLRAIVGRLAVAKLPSYIQSLALPFAYLFCTEHTTQTLDLLSQFSVPMPDGTERNALDVVLSAWCEMSDVYSGSWNIRVSDLGMVKLFALPDTRLSHIIVKGDLIISDANRNSEYSPLPWFWQTAERTVAIITRSRAKTTPNQYTQIPFQVKALKLLLKDLQALGSGKGIANKPDLDIEEDDGDEEWDDDDPLGDGVGEFDYLSSWLDQGGGADTDAQDDDEDLKSDPIAQIDLAAHLTEMLRQCYASNANGMHEMVGALTEVEKGILRGVLTL
ncbi:hypothetical protein JCM24511_07208 [Saitozyma sp. JCM 24511]|nr:hypothetical protein JCM24511_07208 [Saitozyma sp. JCM 24511]